MTPFFARKKQPLQFTTYYLVKELIYKENGINIFRGGGTQIQIAMEFLLFFLLLQSLLIPCTVSECPRTNGVYLDVPRVLPSGENVYRPGILFLLNRKLNFFLTLYSTYAPFSGKETGNLELLGHV